MRVQAQSRALIRVTGDSTVDWRIAIPEGPGGAVSTAYQWEHMSAPGISGEAGGAALLGQVIAAATSDLNTALLAPALPDSALRDPGDTSVTRTYGTWRQYGQRWRLDQFLGVSRAAAELPTPVDDLSASCLVIDDAGRGFRETREQWPGEIDFKKERPDHILYKVAGPVFSNPLGLHLLGAHANRLTSYVAVADLRKGDAAIGQPHSWQQLAEEIVAAASVGDQYGRVGRTIVSLGLVGAVIVEPSGEATLLFDPLHQEGDWERARPGATHGLGTSIMAALAHAVTQNPGAPDWIGAVTRGLVAARAVHDAGFDRDETGALRFPLATVVSEIQRPDHAQSVFQTAKIETGREWLVPTDQPKRLWRLAEKIVLEGVDSAGIGLPVERMGDWVSIDRREIESVRSVRLIASQFLAQERKSRPLNLAVFGPPGSGKSFAVKQMAKEWLASGERIEILEFNVSQFTATADLVTALQRVRDVAVEGKLPLVFWDEFDATIDNHELGWLARFLAPMQDGTFLEGGLTRPIGPAIFVFAGGQSPSFDAFMTKARSDELRSAKATDFLSRLRGHIDILGPNPPATQRSDDRSNVRDDQPADLTFMLRRALLFRSQLQGKAKKLIVNNRMSIDPGVLRAFLLVDEYIHGARSMEALIEMSGLASRLRFERSALPTSYQMGLHVDPANFRQLIQFESDLERPDDGPT